MNEPNETIKCGARKHEIVGFEERCAALIVRFVGIVL